METIKKKADSLVKLEEVLPVIIIVAIIWRVAITAIIIKITITTIIIKITILLD